MGSLLHQPWLPQASFLAFPLKELFSLHVDFNFEWLDKEKTVSKKNLLAGAWNGSSIAEWQWKPTQLVALCSCRLLSSENFKPCIPCTPQKKKYIILDMLQELCAFLWNYQHLICTISYTSQCFWSCFLAICAKEAHHCIQTEPSWSWFVGWEQKISPNQAYRFHDATIKGWERGSNVFKTPTDDHESFSPYAYNHIPKSITSEVVVQWPTDVCSLPKLYKAHNSHVHVTHWV